MDLVIPTCGRWRNQPTLGALWEARLPVTLVVQQEERSQYIWLREPYPECSIAVLPPHITTIAPTRQWIMENVGSSDHICMLDDDLTFYRRRTDDRTKLTDVLPDDLERAFDEMDLKLSQFGHVGFAAREGANRITDPLVYNTRIMRVLGYDRGLLAGLGIRFDRLEVMEDFDVALQLLEKGIPNCLLNNYAHNQAGSGNVGGCSHFRTAALQAANAVKLQLLHPGVVSVVQKRTLAAWGGGERTDVRIQWKKAFAA